jgi:hypothetical protein
VSALPVIGQQPGWIEVRLATRPNQSTAWVPRADVTITDTPYRIVINLTSKHLPGAGVTPDAADAAAERMLRWGATYDRGDIRPQRHIRSKFGASGCDVVAG